MIRLAAGIDIGGTNSRFGIVDANGKILAHDSIKISLMQKNWQKLLLTKSLTFSRMILNLQA